MTKAQWRRLSALVRTLACFQEVKQLANHAYLARVVSDGEESTTPEAESIRRILALLGIDDGYIVDLASGDGVTLSPVLPLFRSGWRGLCLEADLARFQALVNSYRSLSQIHVSRIMVTPRNVVDLLRAFGVPSQFEVLNLDIDSYDLEVANELLTEFQPSVVSLEINEKIPPGIYFSVSYSEYHRWQQDHFYGCSLEAANQHLSNFGYFLVELVGHDALFVQGRHISRFLKLPTVAEAWTAGYWNLPNRLNSYAHNADVEIVYSLPIEEQLRFFHHLFRPYWGNYSLHELR